MHTKEEKIKESLERIETYKEMLKMMPETTLLARLCLISYIKNEERKIEKLNGKLY